MTLNIYARHFYVMGRSQRVKIGKSISESVKLTSGVPQEGILSPIIFIIYGADMEEWVKHSCIFNLEMMPNQVPRTKMNKL